MAAESIWQLPEEQDMPKHMQSWITDTGSLTRHLQAQAEHGFSVKLLGEKWVPALSGEAALLGITSGALVYQREVLLLNGTAADVYARTVIPQATFDCLSERFTNLGTQPLGELLFTDPTVRRGEITVACLQAAQPLYQLARAGFSESPAVLWGRRSPFYIVDKILLVNEIFLPYLTDKQCELKS